MKKDLGVLNQVELFLLIVLLTINVFLLIVSHNQLSEIREILIGCNINAEIA
jgi:hypothetical protein